MITSAEKRDKKRSADVPLEKIDPAGPEADEGPPGAGPSPSAPGRDAMVSSLLKDVEESFSNRDRMCKKTPGNVNDIYVSVKVLQHLFSIAVAEVYSSLRFTAMALGVRPTAGLGCTMDPEAQRNLAYDDQSNEKVNAVCERGEASHQIA